MLLEGGPRILPTYPERAERQGQGRPPRARRRGAREHAREQHRARIHRGRRLDDSHAHGRVGRRQCARARCSSRSARRSIAGPRDRRARLHHPGASRGLRHRRRGRISRIPAGHAARRRPAAIQMGHYVARAIAGRPGGQAARARSGTATRASSRSSAAARRSPTSGSSSFGGFIAWLIWIFVHIAFLIGFRNRVLVMLQWAWSYFTYERGARLDHGRDAGARRYPAAGRSAAALP